VTLQGLRQRALKLAPCAWAAGLFFASSAAAHGGPPVIQRALAGDDRGPFLVELSEGFAVRSEDAWSFVCPALFGADLPPPTASVGGEGFFAGGDDLYTFGASQAAVAAGHADLAGSRVLSMTVLEGDVVALRLRAADASGNAGNEIVRLRGGVVETIYESPDYWSSVVALPGGAGADAKIWVARAASEGIEVLGLSADGTELDRKLAALPIEALTIRLSVAGEHVFAHVGENGGYSLLHVATLGEPAFEAKLATSALLPFAGPALRGEDVLFMRDGELLRWTTEGSEAFDSALGAEPLTCLTPEHACSASGRLYDVDDVEQAGSFDSAEALFDLAQLAGPQLMPAAQEHKNACNLQWIVFRADLVRAGIMQLGGGGSSADAGVPDATVTDADVAPDGAMPAPGEPDSGGCAVRSAPDARGAWWLACFALAALCVRRGRFRGTPSSG
jgi:hypothetical protein